jgi:hypothetical protein
MAWKISGTYIASCSCNVMCPCPVDGPPTGPDGVCNGVGVFHIAEGFQDDTDLAGVDVGLVNLFPSNLTSGGWKLGIVVDPDVSDDQTNALEKIFKGDDGGPFAQFAALTDEWLGVERAPVSFSNGGNPSGRIGDSEFSFEPLPGPEGSGTETTVKNAAFGFAEEYRSGKATGHHTTLGLDFDATYGEAADYEFASEMEEGAPVGR